RDPELYDIRLRVGVVATPARRPRCHEGRHPGVDPSATAHDVWRGAAEAPSVPGAEGGVLPCRLRARPVAARPVLRRARARAGRPASAAGRVAVPPPIESALPADARLSRAL